MVFCHPHICPLGKLDNYLKLILADLEIFLRYMECIVNPMTVLYWKSIVLLGIAYIHSLLLVLHLRYHYYHIFQDHMVGN